MEQVEAALHHWPQAPYANKLDTDANFKRMIGYGFEKEHAKAVHLGIGSHNLFDISYALLLRSENEVEPYVGFEMLEGMADPIRRVVQSLSGEMLLYAPAAQNKDFQYAVAYLTRRLDENTAPENFLRHAFNMKPGSREWQNQASLFSLSCEQIEKGNTAARRTQNRTEGPIQPDPSSPFENEADTDWSLPHHSEWAQMLLKDWSQRKLPLIPLVVNNVNLTEGKTANGIDPSFPKKVLYKHLLANPEQIELALKTAEKASATWSSRSVENRSDLLAQVAKRLRLNRGELIGAMVADGGKTIFEADTEVSEAVDFAEYYRRNLEEVDCLQDLQWKPKGVVVVASPWNFPCSIPAGGILAALAGGNAVIFKPAPEAVLVGWTLVQNFWEAGIGRDVLQFLPCADEPEGSLLIKDPRVSSVVLTGSTDTAKLLMKLRPDLNLSAETGGKNAMIITNMADRELAIKDLIHSAFGHAGQKCSACSLAILEAEVYDDPHFHQALKDAAASLKVGSPWDLSTVIPPLIQLPRPETLGRGLTTLDEGEEWLLKPIQSADNPQLWSPGIKLGVKPGSFTHQTELFGPVLGLMKAQNLEQAIEFANGSRYGLTSGLHSLDEREHQYWLDRIEAGNLYINRGITGAIVQRQPFGGCKQSSFGSGAKAGGPNYVMQLMEAEQKSLPVEKENANPDILVLQKFLEQQRYTPQQISHWTTSIGSYAFYWNHYFSKKHDPSNLLGQDNFLYYLPRQKIVFRWQKSDDLLDVTRVIAAALTVGAPIEISGDAEQLQSALRKIPWNPAKVQLMAETEEGFFNRIDQDKIDRIRFLKNPSPYLLEALAEKSCIKIISPVLANGRVELLHFLREVSLSSNYHRYGYLGIRENEKRSPLVHSSSMGRIAREMSSPCSSVCCTVHH
jgi:RHH-type proline utilization regulon transcriptional repressor/proline dehydrogenase/delta 1-pyrroline-5-carboxylate dehydrogenase